MKIIQWMTFLLIMLLISGCTQENTGADGDYRANENNTSLMRLSADYKQDPSERAQQVIEREHAFNQVIAVNNEDLIIIAVDPEQHDRFRLETLRKDLKEKVSNAFPSYTVELSTDKKISLELNRLRDKLAEERLSQEELNKELERIRKLSKEQT